jgi:hypothetical protein
MSFSPLPSHVTQVVIQLTHRDSNVLARHFPGVGAGACPGEPGAGERPPPDFPPRTVLVLPPHPLLPLVPLLPLPFAIAITFTAPLANRKEAILSGAERDVEGNKLD